MSNFLLLLFFLECSVITIWAARKRERLIQFPFLAVAVFMGWVFPQLLGLRNRVDLPDGALDKLLIMSILCIAASFLGYEKNKKSAKIIFWNLNEKRLLMGSLFLSMFGAYFFFEVNGLAAEANLTTGGLWTGIITIYFFLSKALNVGFVIAVVQYLQKKSWLSMAIIGFDLLFFFDRIILKGRRADMVELFIVIMLGFWFNRGWAPKRWMIIGSLVVGTLLINAIGDYRSTMLAEDGVTASGAGYRDVMQIDFIGNLEKITTGEAYNEELLNAALNIEAADQDLSFDYGASFWNAFIFRYVPGQWIGKDFKNGLMFDKSDIAYQIFGYEAHVGETSTGMTDAFQSFWYFGAINFFLIGLILSRWYLAAMRGNIAAQMIVMLTMTGALHSVTHTTQHFFLALVDLIIFLLPVLYFSKYKKYAVFS